MKVLSKPAVKWIPAGDRVDPYREARLEWDRRDGTARAQKHKWQLACYGLIGITALSQVGLIYLGAQPKVMPRFVEIDRIGAAHYRGAAGGAGELHRPGPGHPSPTSPLRDRREDHLVGPGSSRPISSRRTPW